MDLADKGCCGEKKVDPPEYDSTWRGRRQPPGVGP